MIFHFMGAKNLVTEHNEIDIDRIFHISATQNVVALHYEMDFDMIFCFGWLQNTVNEILKFGCRTLCKKFWHDYTH